MTIAEKINLVLAVIAGISAFIALAYTVVTFHILRTSRATVEAMREQGRLLSRPRVQISPHIRPDSNLFALLIKNTGNSPAYKLNLEIDRKFFVFGEDKPEANLASFSAFSKTIESFPPGAEMMFYLGTGPQLFGDKADPTKMPPAFAITAIYEFDGQKVSETTHIDLIPYENAAIPNAPLVRELERIHRAIDSLRDSLRAGR